ncbi:hypothetical protein F5Y12DRAFT_796606 [Xylaria sp. FL1777]|nr:hypothetical protein F5Y12DRAFT_796606 [Xylaria sp. FL1777]
MATQPEQTGLPCSNANEGHAAKHFDPADGVKDVGALSSCVVCDSQSEMRCSSCGARYCNRGCFMKDWPHHKTLCKTIKDGFHVNKAPTTNVRAILFPMNADKAAWVWINLKTLDISIVRALGIVTKKPLKKSANELAIEDINKSLIHRKIGHGIRQFTAPKARVGDGHNMNKSIFALADPGSLRVYFGSAVFICFGTYEAKGVTKVCYEDASPRDLRMIIEWYYTRPDNPWISKLHRLPIKSYGRPEEEVSLWPAVKIHCDGDKLRFFALSGKPVERIENVQVLSKDALSKNFFGMRSPCRFAAMAQLPWVIQPCHNTLDPINDRDKTLLLHNWEGRIYAQGKASEFHAWNLDHSDGWTLPEQLASTYCGSILVMHKDGCQIDKIHVICFIKYAELAFAQADPIYTRREEETGRVRVLASGSELERFITKEGFEAFWEGFITARIGRLAAAFPSPYNHFYAGETDPVPMTEEEMEKAREKVEKLLLEGA